MSNQESINTRLIGRWRARQGHYTCDWLLRPDGSFSAEVTERGVAISHQIGTWAVEAMELVSVCSDDEFDLVGPGHEERDSLLEIAEHYFILRTKQGTRRKYERVH